MDKSALIYVAGHTGLVGSSIVRALKRRGATNLLLPARSELDLRNQSAVDTFFSTHRPAYVFVAAAKVGGILFNQRFQADFLYENIMIAGNVIHSAAEHGTEKLLYLGSSCIYPKMCPQPIKEDYLLTGPLEPSNEGYALAKIAGLKLCEKFATQYGKRFIAAMPTNLYGPGDNFHPEHSHVIPGMMRRLHEAKLTNARDVTIWGSGTPRREFLHVDDLSEALVQMMERYEEPGFLNIGCGKDVTILELAQTMQRVIGFKGEIVLDRSKPDGTPRKMLDTTKINTFGWSARIELEHGLSETYKWACQQGIFNAPQKSSR